ncbi:MAG: ThiF family adenylyltransferase [Candidatus Woesebacteria bacterium]|nr:ThiF family adenylyltransferase [Candidatus Woesebacteria bacterium]
MKEQNRQPDWSRIDQAITKEKRELLATKNVAIIGIGSLGSEVARLLTIAGIGNFTLIDPDRLDESNVLRHWADLRDVGKYKVNAVKNLIKQRNPQANVTAVAKDATKVSNLFTNLDMAIIAGLGTNGAQFQVAESLRQKGVTVVETAIYDKGNGGEVLIVKPNEGPCYACFSTFLNRSIDAEVRNGKIYCANVAPEQAPSFPALAIHINRIATIAAEFAVDFLKNTEASNDSGKNLIIYANRKMLLGKSAKDGHEIFLNPLQAVSYAVPKDPDCLICSSTNSLSDVSLEDLFNGKGGE